jgi:hypothetical protein
VEISSRLVSIVAVSEVNLLCKLNFSDTKNPNVRVSKWMKFFERSHVYNSDFDTVTSAWFVKYPNPQTQHVKEIHTYDRYISETEFRLSRLFYLEYGIPSWIQKIMRKRMEGYANEEITCTLNPKMLRAVGRNITFSSIFQMEEVIEYKPDPNHPDTKTIFTQKMQFRVLGFGLMGAKLETAARDSAEKKSGQGLQVMETIIDKLKQSDWRNKANEWRLEIEKMAEAFQIPEMFKHEEIRKKAEKAEEKINAEIMSSFSLHPDDEGKYN